MSREHRQTEQLYLAFHSWRARMEGELDRLDTDYLNSLCTDMQRVLSRIQHELTARDAAVRRSTNDVAPAMPSPHEWEFELRSASDEVHSFSANDRSIAEEPVATTERAGG